MSDKRSVTVIGAGLAGLACARELSEQGLAVIVFDKGRTPGGRATSRQADTRTFDHGAQFFTARGPWLSSRLPSWEQAGVVGRWAPRIAKPAEVRGRAPEAWWVGTPRMSALATHLARDLDVRLGHTASAIARTDGSWFTTLGNAAGATLVQQSSALVIAIPAPQCAALLAPQSPLVRAAAGVEPTPCWAVMIAVRTDRTLDVDLFEDRAGPIAWAAREASKPARTRHDGEELWTLHASTAWSQAHCEDSPEDVCSALVSTFVDQRYGDAATVVHAKAHRWRYARGCMREDQPGVLLDATASLAICGDWLAGERVEDALTSGITAAQRIGAALLPTQSNFG